MSTATISAFDSGFHYADGCFESIRVYNRRVFRFDDHLDRLYAGVKILRLPLVLGRSELVEAIVRWLKANEVIDGFHFKIMVTRGPRRPPRLDFRFAPGPATVVMTGNDLHGPARGTLRLASVATRRPAADALDPRLKTMSWGANVQARLEANDHGADDALMLDANGFTAASCAANVFAVRQGRLLTPYPRACLRGITRQTVIELAADLGLPAAEADLSTADLKAADEVFLTGTSSELIPVGSIDGCQIGEGDGPGPWMARLLAAYRELANGSGEVLL